MIRTAAVQDNKIKNLASSGKGILQRKCGSCSSKTTAEDECADCSSKNNYLQRKLSIGASSDPLEHEADRVAEQVVRIPEQNFQLDVSGVERECFLRTKPLLQCSRDDGASIEVPPIVHEVLSSSGHPLDLKTRNYMEPRFGRDLGRVRVHVNRQASASARAVQAHAYTVGHDIVFGTGKFAPQANWGRRLLAHELAHVIQQTGGEMPQNVRLARPTESTPKAASNASSATLQRFTATSPIQVQNQSTSRRLSRQNIQQTTSVLSQGAIASAQLITDGVMNSTRVGPVSQRRDVSAIVGRLTTVRKLAKVLLPLWNSATPFTPQGGTAPNVTTPLTVDELAQGLLMFNRYRLAIPPASNPPAMTNWQIGMRFPLPIRIDSATNEGVLHPNPIRRMAGAFIPVWTHLLDALPAVLQAQPAANLQQSVASFLVNHSSTSARGIHLGTRAVRNAQDSQEFILEVFNQVGAGAFNLALEFMDWRVNRDIAVLAPQTAGAAILNRIRALLAAPPAVLIAAQQSSLTRANGMLGRVATVPLQPDPCVPNRKLTWNSFAGAVPASSSFEAETHFQVNQVAFQGNQLFQATLNQGASWVRPRSRQPTNMAVNGCQPQISACETHFNGLPAGSVGATWGLSGTASTTCPASIVSSAVTARNVADCTTVIGAECTRARQADSLQRLLPHEQLHFDIPCVLVHKANAARAAGATVTLATVRSRTNALTRQYDSSGQTKHGCNSASQSQWETDVANGLPAQTFP